MMNRVTFLVDGFNLYHSVREAEKSLKASTKWLNISELCSSYLPLIRGVESEKTELIKVYYFSALAKHLERNHPDVTIRHKTFLKCLEDTGVLVQLSRFKPKQIKCPSPKCGHRFVKHEEKETDVAIAIKIFAVFITDECDTVVLLTGDTDLAPAARTAKRLFPDKHILFAFPFNRKNKELLKIAQGSFNIKPKKYTKFQFPNPYELSNGDIIKKPTSW